MPILASDIMDKSRVHLNDVPVDLYTNTVLLPFLKTANDDLSDNLVDNGISIQKEASADITLVLGGSALTLPADFLLPIELFEKNVGEDDNQFRILDQKSFLPDAVDSSECGVWAWLNQQVLINPATQIKVIRLRYYRILAAITAASTPIEVANSLNYLAFHTAAMAAASIGKNSIEAQDLADKAEERLSKILNPQIKENQGFPVRRKAFRLPHGRRTR